MQLKGFTRSAAFLVGVSEYEHPIQRLLTPVNDAERIKENLCDFQDIELHEDICVNAFSSALDAFIAKSNQQSVDRIFFYFAGHGTTINNETRPEGYIILQNNAQDENSGNFKIGVLIDKLNELKSKHVLIVLDCCFAGSVQWDILKRPAGRRVREEITDPLYNAFVRNPAWQIIVSTGPNQEALDSINPVKSKWGDGLRLEKNSNSPFAKYFINALKGLNRDDFFPGNIITTLRLYDYIYRNVQFELKERNINHRQEPGYFTLLKHRNGNFIFSIKNLPISTPNAIPLANPYRGFNSYDENDAEVFFGRDVLIKKFETEIEKKKRLFYVTGPSGIGKSSIVKAGFIPLILRFKNFTNLKTIRPSNLLGDEVNKLNDRFTELGDQKFVLFVDQFEELLNVDPEKRKLLVDLLELAGQRPNVYVIIAIRDDRIKLIEQTLSLDWETYTKIKVEHPTDADIEDIIVKPALRHATIIKADGNERDFIMSIIKAYSKPGNLPILSTALHQWFYESVIEPKRQSPNQERFLLQAKFANPELIEEVFKKKMELVLSENQSKLISLQRIMFRLIDYYEDLPIRKAIPIQFIPAEDQSLIASMVEHRIIHFKETQHEESENKESQNETFQKQKIEAEEKVMPTYSANDVIELAHDSIVEKWLVKQPWFIARNQKSRNNISEIIRAQNELIPAVIAWEEQKANNRKTANKCLWIYEKELPLLEADIAKRSFERNFVESFRTFWGRPSAIEADENAYFDKNELAFLQTSSKQSRIKGKSFLRVVCGVLAIVILFSAFIVYQIFETKKQANKNLAYLYAEKSLTEGETEALVLLKKAYSLNPSDSNGIIKDRLNKLLNERDHYGNPFAVSSFFGDIPFEPEFYDSSSNMFRFTDRKGDSIIWDYATDTVIHKKVEGQKKIGFVELKDGVLNCFAADSFQIKAERSIDQFQLSLNEDTIYYICCDSTLTGDIYCKYKLAYYSLNDKQVHEMKDVNKLLSDKMAYRVEIDILNRLVVLYGDSIYLVTFNSLLIMNNEYDYTIESALGSANRFNQKHDRFYFQQKNVERTASSICYFDFLTNRIKYTGILVEGDAKFFLDIENNIFVNSCIRSRQYYWQGIFLKYNIELKRVDTLFGKESKAIYENNQIEISKNGMLFYYRNDSQVFYKQKFFDVEKADIFKYSLDGNYVYSIFHDLSSEFFKVSVYSLLENDSLQLIHSCKSTIRPLSMYVFNRNKQLLIDYENGSKYVFNIEYYSQGDQINDQNWIPRFYNVENESTGSDRNFEKNIFIDSLNNYKISVSETSIQLIDPYKKKFNKYDSDKYNYEDIVVDTMNKFISGKYLVRSSLRQSLNVFKWKYDLDEIIEYSYFYLDKENLGSIAFYSFSPFNDFLYIGNKDKRVIDIEYLKSDKPVCSIRFDFITGYSYYGSIRFSPAGEFYIEIPKGKASKKMYNLDNIKMTLESIRIPKNNIL